MLHYVYGDESRIFMNTALGCEAKCRYCYLPRLGAEKAPVYISAEEALSRLYALPYFVQGQEGTIISIGCYSECWDDKNKQETFKIIAEIVKMGNYVQLATKKGILWEEFVKLDSLALFKNQIGVYLSVPTLTHSGEVEKGTDCIEKRLAPLQYSSKVRNIYCVIYIKPVLTGITILDCEKYETLLKQHRVAAVVGSLYEVNRKADNGILVGEGNFEEIIPRENDILVERLRQVEEVFEHSTDVIRKIRKEKSRRG